MSGPYDDIIALPHRVSPTHARMPAADRAAQFSPFAALTGLGAAMAETARLTDARIELDECELEALNEILTRLRGQLAQRPLVTLTYFRPDEKKEGGAYITRSARIARLRELERLLILEDGTKIPLDDIVELGTELPAPDICEAEST